MAARKRKPNETFEKYRKALKVEQKEVDDMLKPVFIYRVAPSRRAHR